ncbi:MAG: beta strand repeat-containing protein, partial [Parvicellaceae bacterium]
MKKCILILIYLTTCHLGLFSQTTIYSEDFTGQNNKGWIFNSSDFSGVDWTMDVSDASLSASTDWFAIKNEKLEARDVDGDAYWYSPIISISSYHDVEISVAMSESGTMEGSDMMSVTYRLDGGSWVALTNGVQYDDFSPITATAFALSGSTLELKINMFNGAGSEYHRADDILVQGVYIGPTGTPGLWTGASSTLWSDAGNWDDGAVPTSSINVVIPSSASYVNPPHVNIVGASCGSLTVQNGGVLNIGNSSCKLTTSSINIIDGGELVLTAGEIESSGKVDWDGTISMSGSNSILDFNSEVELTSSSIAMISGGTIYCSGTWDGENGSSWAPSGGVVIMDASSAQSFSMHNSANFHDFTIDNQGSTTTDLDLDSHLNVDGDLTITRGDIDGDDNNNLYLAGNLICSSGDLDDLEEIHFDGSGDVTTTAFTDYQTDVFISKSSAGSVTTNGNIGGNKLTVTLGTFVIDGETITFDYSITISGGSLNIISGLLSCTNDINSNFNISGGTLDVDGGEVRVGDIASDETADLEMSSGTIDLSGGTINIVNELDVSYGAITISGGFLNLGASTSTNNLGSDGGHTFDMDAGTLNLSGGTLSILRANASGTTEALDISPGVTITSSVSFNVVVGRGASTSEDLLLDFNISGSECFGNLTIDCGAFDAVSKESLNILGDLSISSGELIAFSGDGSDENIDIQGDIISAGTNLISGFNDVTFEGLSSQSISGNNTFISLTINNAYGLTLAGSTTLQGVLTLTSGNIISESDVNANDSQIYASTNTITLKDGATVSGGSASSHVVGAVRAESSGTTEIEFPTGDGTNYRPAYLTPSNSTATTYTVEYVNAAHSSIAYDGNGYNNTPVGAGIDHVAMGCWWDIEKSSGGSDAYIAITWDANSGVNIPADILLTHWNSSTSMWEDVPVATATLSDGTGAATASSGRIKSTSAQSDFSPWSPGSSTPDGGPLPVDLISFQTNCSHDIVDVNFSILSQVNNDKFLIERSTDAIDWEVIGEI